MTEQTLDYPEETTDAIDADRIHAILARTAIYLAALLFLAIMALAVYSLWLDVRPVTHKPKLWRDKARGNICYIWETSIVCLPDHY